MGARFKVLRAGPFVSVQDIGRTGYKRYGVTGSGAMDRFSYRMANIAVNQSLSNPALEVSLGGLELLCEHGTVAAAIAGGNFNIQLDDKSVQSCSTVIIKEGSVLRIRPGPWGSWCYVAFAGSIDSDSWLGSQSVHLNSGLCGKPIEVGDTIQLSDTATELPIVGNFQSADELKPDTTIRAVLGPQDHYFTADSIDALFSEAFLVTADYNRMGVRLSGPKLKISSPLDMPSEPIARGSLQVPGHGDPLLLLADHQSTGGYPKVATVISCDQDSFAQLRSGDKIRFESLQVAEAIEAVRFAHQSRESLFGSFARNAISLEERLAGCNLISGVTDASANTEPFV